MKSSMSNPDIRNICDWPEGSFDFLDSPGAHDPCYIVMPGGGMLPINHHAKEGVDIARARFIVNACNAALPDAIERDAVLEWCWKRIFAAVSRS